jgi:serine/threonine protein kinase
MAVTASVDDDDEGFPRPFGQYVLLENFARGGMGEVYLAKYGDVVEKYCVLKKLRKELTRDREYVTRFIDEARVVVTLNHANICHVFDVGRVGDEYYLAMEYVSGRDVRSLMDRAVKREKPLPPACALQLTCETLEALDYAHRRVHPMTQEALNLVHRDVSPQNVLVSYEGEVKLIDFGLAASKLKVERTQPNVVMGKMAYMAPEQARGDGIDARADLFACGVLCYELMTGERFYEGMSANDIWNVAGKGGHTPKKWDSIDPAIAKILAKALHPDAKKRFATCGEFREALASEMHWRFPGSGVKSLRDVMADLFSDEMARERDMLQRFGKVTVQSFRDEMETTSSHSISLAAASQGTEEKSAQLVRNEQSQSGGATMPPPGRDLHVEPTRVGTVSDTAQNAKSRSTDEASVKTPATAKHATTEMTARVVRTSTAHHEPTALVRDRDRHQASTQIVRDRSVTLMDLNPEEQTALGSGKRAMLYGLMLGAAVLAGGVAFFVASGGDDGVVATTDGAHAPIDDTRAPTPPALAQPAPPLPAASVDAGAVPVPIEPKRDAVVAAPVTTAPVDAAPTRPVEVAPATASAGVEPVESVQSAGARDGRPRDRRGLDKKRDPKPAADVKAAEARAAEARAAEEKAAADKAAADAQAAKMKAAASGDKALLSDSKRSSLVTKIFKKGAACQNDVLAANKKAAQDGTAAAKRTRDETVIACAKSAGIAVQ